MILKITRNLLFLSAILTFGVGISFGQTSYTFSASSATGNTGPTQAQCDAQYAGTNLAGNVTVTGGIQYWTVPTSGAYSIECFGGQGYGPFGGRGAHIKGEFNLTAGTQLKILVGQEAGHYFQYPSTSYNGQFGGGGGSFVTDLSNNPFVIAGGGGGSHLTAYSTTADGQITTNGQAGTGTVTGTGGTAGSGGGAASSADGGGGLLSNGLGLAGGQSFANGALGGIDEGTGGFGCGGGTSSWNNFRGGGGGGYSGGGGGNNNGPCCPNGGGGGSFNGGTNPIEFPGVQLGDGMIVITSLQTFPNDAGVSQIVGLTPPYCNGPQLIQVEVVNYGNNVINNVGVGWSINGTNQPQISLTTSIDTNNSTAGNTLIVTLGTVNINGNTTINAWTISPNSSTDSSPLNDSTSITMTPFFVSANAPFPTLLCSADMNGLGQPTPSNNVGAVSYVWSNGSTSSNLTGVGAGTYYVIGSNGNCIDTSNTITITAPPAIVATAQTTNITCFGANDGGSFVSASGGTPGYTVNWPGNGPGFSIGSLSPGNHNYVVTDANGCNITNTITVTEPPLLTVTSVISNVTTTNNGAIDVTAAGGTPNYFYTWSNAATTEDLTGLLPGTYTVTVTDANGCTAVLGNDVLNVVGLNDKSLELGLKIYPNPNSGTFTINALNTNDKIDVQVFDLLGKKVLQLNQVNPKTTVTLNERDGVYLVKIKSGNDIRVQKVILKR
ncbi:MAG: T9SS type A sorting domain-containing protein [Crocinitomicaceae bacterium]|nr:T9SS type A sorting domain-containing protein [Crocinitomicaceae bacterium]